MKLVIIFGLFLVLCSTIRDVYGANDTNCEGFCAVVLCGIPCCGKNQKYVANASTCGCCAACFTILGELYSENVFGEYINQKPWSLFLMSISN